MFRVPEANNENDVAQGRFGDSLRHRVVHDAKM